MAEMRRLCVNSSSGFTCCINCESWFEPKNSRSDTMSGFGLISIGGIQLFISAEEMRSRVARRIWNKPMRNWFSNNSPMPRTRRLLR